MRACVPSIAVCAPGSAPPVSEDASAVPDSAGPPGICGALDGPEVESCCQACTPGGPKPCQANHCYGGWFCNRDLCKCQAPPAASHCPSQAVDGQGEPDSSALDAFEGADAQASNPGGSLTLNGGAMDQLMFGIVGDTRPPLPDDTAGYPTAIAAQIWARVAAAQPPLVVTTGDYVFASTYANQTAPQLDLYLKAASAYSGLRLPVLGNHECTGATASNCGPGTKNGITNNYSTFVDKMLKPLGLAQPWYSVPVEASDKSWTAKFVVIAANAWNAEQAAWLDLELSKPTTYTFVVRHEPFETVATPGVPPSNAIIAKHPMTILLCGHTHTFAYKPSSREVVVGNGGAPLSGSVNYGYVLARRRNDGAIAFTAYDYATGQAVSTFAVQANGVQTP